MFNPISSISNLLELRRNIKLVNKTIPPDIRKRCYVAISKSDNVKEAILKIFSIIYTLQKPYQHQINDFDKIQEIILPILKDWVVREIIIETTSTTSIDESIIFKILVEYDVLDIIHLETIKNILIEAEKLNKNEILARLKKLYKELEIKLSLYGESLSNLEGSIKNVFYDKFSILSFLRLLDETYENLSGSNFIDESEKLFSRYKNEEISESEILLYIWGLIYPIIESMMFNRIENIFSPFEPIWLFSLMNIVLPSDLITNLMTNGGLEQLSE